MAREQESQDLNKAKREMFDELIKLHAKAAEKLSLIHISNYVYLRP